MFQSMRDKALSQGAKIAINTQMEDYGKVQSLYLDSKKKSIDLEVMLAGEIETLSVHINHYELSEINGHHQLKVNSVTTSRSWVNTLITSYLEGKSFDVPVEYVKMIKAVI